MSIRRWFYLFAILTVLFGCNKNSDDVADAVIDENINLPKPLPVVLIFPEDNTECNEGEIESDTNSKVTFEWTISANTDNYEIQIRNLNTNQIITKVANTNSVTVSILRGTPFEWNVISKANNVASTAASAKWQFFNAGTGIENHAPFPASLTSPKNQEVVDSYTASLYLKWNSNDLDNDVLEFEVFFGTDEVFENPVAITSDKEYFFGSSSIVKGDVYYWKIKSIDSKGNSSMSQVFSFTAN